MIDPFILGDNAFFGVNHHSRQTGEQQAGRFENVSDIIAVYRAVKQLGVRGAMLSSHDRTHDIVKAILKDPGLGKEFNLYPNIPYLMKYVQKVTRHGILGTLREMFWDPSCLRRFRTMISGAWGLATQDFIKMLKSVVDLEMSAYRGASVKAIFLHNGLTDLALGLEAHEVFRAFGDHVRRRYGAAPGFGTLNLPRLAAALVSAGVEDAVIMAPVNRLGFHMNPSQRDNENVLESSRFTIVAMNILGSGAVSAREAFAYLAKFTSVRHVIVGSTNERHIAECLRLRSEPREPFALLGHVPGGPSPV